MLVRDSMTASDGGARFCCRAFVKGPFVRSNKTYSPALILQSCRFLETINGKMKCPPLPSPSLPRPQASDQLTTPPPHFPCNYTRGFDGKEEVTPSPLTYENERYHREKNAP